MRFTLGLSAEIKVSDPRSLDEPVLHRIPSVALIQRLRWYASVETRGWALA